RTCDTFLGYFNEKKIKKKIIIKKEAMFLKYKYFVITIYTTGTSTPPGISATAVPSIAAQIGVNGFSALPHQTNGQPASEHIYTNGIHPYPAQSPTVADPLQQAYAGVQHYAGESLFVCLFFFTLRFFFF
uniref:Uncharacterized protein n=1 Tax=Cyprinus carpio TaxID=7962 RepID=A0A8C2F342_CYPCA